MHVKIVGTSIRTEDILYITDLKKGQHNYASKFTIAFRTGQHVDIELNTENFGLDKNSLEDIAQLKVHMKKLRDELDIAWRGEGESKTISLRELTQ